MRSVFGLLCTLGLAAAGCGTREGRIEVHPVSGSVVVGGVEAAGVRLMFHPATNEATQVVFPRAQTDEHGEFILSTYEADDGIPAGDYVVTASWKVAASLAPEEMHPDALSLLEERLEARFTDPERTPLRVVVEDRNNHLAPFELKLAPNKRKRRKRR